MKNLYIFVVVLSLISVASTTVLSVGNGFFTIHCDDTNGIFTVATGASHPVGAGHSVLFGGDVEQPYTSYLSIFSETSGIIYVTTENYVENATQIMLDNLYTEADGFTAIYSVSDSNDDFQIQQKVKYQGNTYLSSSIVWEVLVTNYQATDLTIGTRFLWDYQIAEDDGPSFATQNPDSQRYLFERQWNSVTYETYSIEGNRPQSSYFEVVGAAAGPVPWYPQPEPPLTKVVYSSWVDKFFHPFIYDLDELKNVAVNVTLLEDDSCVLLYWGDEHGGLSTLAPYGTKSFQSSFSVRSVLSPEELVSHCSDNISCTYDHINPRDVYTLECIFIPMNYSCQDEDLCTIDFCDANRLESEPETGCVHLQIDCSDQIPCTEDFCFNGQCFHTPYTCDDFVNCTIDSCDLDLGTCTNIPDDDSCQPWYGDKCKNFHCDPSKGCVFTDVVCDDSIDCTIDECFPNVGCTYTPQNFQCDDNITCTEDLCEEHLGKCTNYPRNEWCNNTDSNLCTTEFCDIVQDCVSRAMTCDDPDMKCTNDFCLEGICYHIADDNNCDDNNNCTVDTCDMGLGKCTNIPDDDYCDDDQFCTDDYCDEAYGCINSIHVCNDQIWCTEDICDFDLQTCVHTTINESITCDDSIECTIDTCNLDLGRCDHQANNSLCDDLDPCTTDICDVGNQECIHIPMVCNDQIACTNDTCVEGECVFEYLNSECEDNVYCTVDVCSELIGNCENIPYHSRCEDSIDCTLDICNSTDCVHISRDDWCDDGFPCTVDWCDDTFGCRHEAIDEVCEDGIECTLEKCSLDFGCVFAANHTACEDEHDCTHETCDLNFGCQVEYHHEECNDDTTCSEDTCTEFGCDFAPRNDWCNDDVGCTFDYCDLGAKDCLHMGVDTLCEDGRDCSHEICDVHYGCVINDTNCPIDLQVEHCINCKSTRSRFVVNDLTDGAGDLILRTRNGIVEDYAVASPIDDLVDNVLFKGTGPVVFGQEDILDFEDGLVIAHDSSFRLVPSQSESLPLCNEVTRGLVQIITEQSQNGIDMMDTLYICLRKSNSFEWEQLSKPDYSNQA